MESLEKSHRYLSSICCVFVLCVQLQLGLTGGKSLNLNLHSKINERDIFLQARLAMVVRTYPFKLALRRPVLQ